MARFYHMALWASVVMLLACGVEDGGSTFASKTQSPERLCNGHARLCERPYNEVLYLTTHNAMSHADAFWFAPNQNHAVSRQLADGARGISLDLFENPDDPNEPLLCHGTCIGGSILMGVVLRDIRYFLAEHPDEVLTILYEHRVPDEIVADIFQRMGLGPYLHAQPPGEEWPTLREMIDSGRRLVVFSQDTGGGEPWLHRMWEYTWDTPYSYQSPADFDCRVGRGDPENPIFQINHFLTAPLAGEALAREANRYEVLMSRVERCIEETGQRPTFLWVDWYATGDALEVVDELNRSWNFPASTP